MTENILNRKGARKVQDIPEKILDLLNQGAIPSVNLTEWIAINHITLIKHCFPQIGISNKIIDLLILGIQDQKKPTAMNSTKIVGSILYNQLKDQGDYDNIVKCLLTHPSDAIRCYAPYLIALNEKYSLEEKLNQSLASIADQHFGVREVVWMALRSEITNNLDQAIQLLSEWTQHKDENVRRFTTESTRPRGVWCKHIDELKERPEKAHPILEKLKNDPSKYVQDSVGNWLNDASKTQPEFVKNLCDKWSKESPTKETEKIIKRAMRTIDKK